MSYEEYIKFDVILQLETGIYIGSEPKEQSIIGYENRCVND